MSDRSKRGLIAGLIPFVMIFAPFFAHAEELEKGNSKESQLESEARAILSGKDDALMGGDGISTLEDYIGFNERIKSLDLEITKMRKQMELLKIRKDILDLAQPKVEEKSDNPMGQSRLPVYRQSADVERLIDQKLKSQSDQQVDPIDSLKLSEIFMDGGQLLARVYGASQAITVSIGEFVYSWRVTNITSDSVTVEKAGQIKKIGFQYR